MTYSQISATVSSRDSGLFSGLTKNRIGNIKIYPNPANSILNVEGLHRETTGRIYNANGQMIFSSEVGAENGELNVSKLPSGFYILKMDIDDSVVMKRFMKK